MTKLLIVSGIFVTALTVLVWVGIVDASIPVLNLSQLDSPDYAGGSVKVNEGKVKSIHSKYPLRITVEARNDPSSILEVESTVSPPDNLIEGRDVGLMGEYSREKKLFRAYKVTTVCPSKYEASKDGASKDGGPVSNYASEPQTIESPAKEPSAKEEVKS
jgi:cytochrome c-type biogenesis protein CcmE